MFTARGFLRAQEEPKRQKEEQAAAQLRKSRNPNHRFGVNWVQSKKRRGRDRDPIRLGQLPDDQVACQSCEDVEEEVDRMKRRWVQSGNLTDEAVGHHLKWAVIVAGTLLIRVRVAPDVSDKETTQRFVSMKKGISYDLKIVIPDEFVIEGIGEGQYTENGENTKPDCMMPTLNGPD